MKAREERPQEFRPTEKRGLNRNGPLGGAEKGRERRMKVRGQGNAREIEGGSERITEEKQGGIDNMDTPT
jgi:hypothetical protein